MVTPAPPRKDTWCQPLIRLQTIYFMTTLKVPLAPPGGDILTHCVDNYVCFNPLLPAPAPGGEAGTAESA